MSTVAEGDMILKSLVVKLPNSLEDDVIVLHCTVPSVDPIAALGLIIVTGAIFEGHLTPDQARRALALVGGQLDIDEAGWPTK